MYKIKTLLATVLAGILLYGCSGGDNGTENAGSGKNLLLICIDTVRADTFAALSALEDDSLADWESSALVFDNAQAPSPWTVPSIASVFTGLWPAHHGTGLFPGLIGRLTEIAPSPMPEQVPVLTQYAREAGYDTSALTASFWTSDRARSRGLMRGFGQIVDFDISGAKTDWRPLINTWSEETLPGAGSSNFYHYIHLMDAHEWHVTTGADLEALYDAIPAQRRAQYLEMAPPQACRNPQSPMCKSFQVYVSAVRAVREAIASSLDTLKAQGLLENTIVVVFSDHGEEFLDHFGDRRMDSDSLTEVMEAFGHGRTLYKEQLHVPLLVWHPERQAQHVEDAVSLLDIAPSLAAWLGLEFPSDGTQGVLLDDYLSPGRTMNSERVLFGSAINSGEQQLSAQQGDKKAIWYLVSDHIDYYDLAEDPAELTAVSNDRFVMAFDGLFLDYMQAAPKREVAPGQLSDEQVRRLQSIGYLQGVDTSPTTGDK